MQTLTLRCTLKPATEQVAALEATVRLFAEGCNHALRVAREKGEFRRFKLHRLVYNDLRSMGLSANLAVQAIARVGRKKGSRAKFYQPTSATFDVRTLSLRDESVFLTTTAGRLVIPMKLGNYISQTCSSCGHRQKIPLSERVFKCPCCGLELDRDHNAAVNILGLGLQSLGINP